MSDSTESAHGDQSDAQEMDESAKSARENQSSYYDLLCKVVEPQQARHITRILTDLCHCDENSYPFLQGILSATHLRLAINLPEAVAKKVSDPLEDFQRRTSNSLDEFYKQCLLLREALNHREIAARAITTKSLTRSGWPFNQEYQWRIARYLQSFIGWCEERTAYRFRWIALCSLAIGVPCFMVHRQQFSNEMSLVKQQDLNQRQLALNSAAEKLAELKRNYDLSLDQRSNEIAIEKLQNLEPRSYRLAQKIEKDGRRVTLPSGRIAWELTIRSTSGIPTPQLRYDSKLDPIIKIFLPDTDGEMALTDVSPSIPAKTGTRAK